jgi:hypothetical protein
MPKDGVLLFHICKSAPFGSLFAPDGLATPHFFKARPVLSCRSKIATASSHQSGKFRSVQRLALLLISHPVAGAVGAGFGAAVYVHGLAGTGNS